MKVIGWIVGFLISPNCGGLAFTKNQTFYPTSSIAALPRIIDGQNADESQYSFVVSLQKPVMTTVRNSNNSISRSGFRHKCGGTLIAPDMVLTAAHCTGTKMVRIKKRNSVDTGVESGINDYDDIPVWNEIQYPLRQSVNDLDHDIMILRLLTPAKHHTPVRLNDDPSLPHTHSNLTVLGWGRTDLHTSYDPPPLLQQTHMTYLDPNVCAQRNSKYTPDMMCAEGINPTRGPCRGDSGGPLLMNSNHQSKAKLVGIVSFSQIECVHPLFPSFFARVSASYYWIRDVVCQFSVDSPAYFECPTHSPATTSDEEYFSSVLVPSSAPNEESDDGISVLLQVKVDAFPDDIVWYMETTDIDNNPPQIVAQQPMEGYTSTYATYFDEIHGLRSDTNYSLVFQDRKPGGMNGFITLYLGLDPDPSKVLLFVDLYEIGSFSVRSFSFIPKIDQVFVLPMTSPPSSSPTSTLLPGMIQLQFRFRTYVDARPLGWRLESLEDSNHTWTNKSTTSSSETIILHETGPGMFRGNEPILQESLTVTVGGDYVLVLTNFAGTGFRGEVSVFVGSVESTDTLVAYYNGNDINSDLRDYFFEYSIPFKASWNATVDIFPTISPSIVAQTTTAIWVLVTTDENPDEIGWNITTLSGDVLVDVPPGTYQKSDAKYVHEIGNVVCGEEYVLTLLDLGMNGMAGRIVLYQNTEKKPLATLHSLDKSFWVTLRLSFAVPCPPNDARTAILTNMPSTALPSIPVVSSFEATRYSYLYIMLFFLWIILPILF